MPRTADPSRDLTVIDARAPRFNQGVVAASCLVALATGWWPIFGVLAVHLGVTVLFGRQYCLPFVFYFQVVQPRFGEGPLEDARAPRFANLLAGVFLSGATVASAAGLHLLGLVLGALVGGLATLSLLSGLCVGCEVYRLLARLRGIRHRLIERIDLERLGALGLNEFIVEFVHPLCSDCQELEARLKGAGHQVVKVDVSKQRDLAVKYGISLVPLAFAVRGDGTVLARVG